MLKTNRSYSLDCLV